MGAGRAAQNLESPFDFQAAKSTIPDMRKHNAPDPLRLFTLVVSRDKILAAPLDFPQSIVHSFAGEMKNVARYPSTSTSITC